MHFLEQVWSHGWFVNMFEVASMDKAAHSVNFATAESYALARSRIT